MFIKWLEKIQLTVGVISLSVFFITIIVQIFSRYLGMAMIWTEEVANYSFIWAVFMGAAVMLNRREHFRFDFLLFRLPEKPRAYLSLAIEIILLVFSLAIFYYGLEAVNSFWHYNWASLPGMKMGYVWISVPIMGLTSAIYCFDHIMGSVRMLMRKEAAE